MYRKTRRIRTWSQFTITRRVHLPRVSDSSRRWYEPLQLVANGPSSVSVNAATLNKLPRQWAANSENMDDFWCCTLHNIYCVSSSCLLSVQLRMNDMDDSRVSAWCEDCGSCAERWCQLRSDWHVHVKESIDFQPHYLSVSGLWRVGFSSVLMWTCWELSTLLINL